MLDAFWTVFDNATDASVKSTPDAISTLRDHRRILEAVRSGSVDAARDALADSYVSFEQRSRTAARLQGEPQRLSQT
jgi:DNA-binding FadR family transcriptional regulator